MVLFTDRATGFSTTDVYDAQGQMVRFNTAGQLIWTVDDSRFDGYRVAGNYVGDRSLEVRFGGKSEERRAYLTFSLDYFHYDPPASVVDLEVIDGRLVISNANPPVPLPET